MSPQPPSTISDAVFCGEFKNGLGKSLKQAHHSQNHAWRWQVHEMRSEVRLLYLNNYVLSIHVGINEKRSKIMFFQFLDLRILKEGLPNLTNSYTEYDVMSLWYDHKTVFLTMIHSISVYLVIILDSPQKCMWYRHR